MKLVFIDETDRQASSTVHAFFSICGLVIDESEIMATTNELEEIKKKYNFSNLKESRKSGLSEQEKVIISTEVFDCLKKHNASIISIVLGDFSMSFNMPKDDLYMGAIQFLMERFCLILMKVNSCGLAIFDCTEKRFEKKLREKFYEYIQTQTVHMAWESKPRGPMRDFIQPTLFFADDEQSILIQAVDLIAVSLNSAIVNITQSNPKIMVADLPSGNKFLNIYWPLFASSSSGKVEGWGVKVWD
ncbi:MAG: hypothetical protein JWM20_841 [Patescibacteria group bacterium]|nr:hypothetical protein [Patescibacteria group bacterium]